MVNDCFVSLQIKNDLIESTSLYGSEETILETFPLIPSHECNVSLCANFIYDTVPTYLTSPITHWEVSRTAKVLWLGALAKEGHWRPLNYDEKKQSLIGAISRTISVRLRSYPDVSRRPECSLQCHMYSTSPYSFREEISLELSPQELGSYQTGIETASCSPSIIIAGFAQSAVSIVYSLLLLHPQVLPLLGTALFQEDQYHYKPSCYRTDIYSRWIHVISNLSLVERAFCFDPGVIRIFLHLPPSLKAILSRIYTPVILFRWTKISAMSSIWKHHLS